MANESYILDLIPKGVFSIDKVGRIWRHGTLKLYGSKESFYPAHLKRAEHPQKDGYLLVGHHVNRDSTNRHIWALAHRVVYLYFFGELRQDRVLNHKNGIKTDNRPENLEQVTSSENSKHSFRIGLQDNRGDKNPRHKLKRVEVECLRKRFHAGETIKKLGMGTKVSYSTLRRALLGETWK